MTREGHFSKCLTGTNLLLVLPSLLDHLAKETEAQRDEGPCEGDTIGRWWGWIWTRAHVPGLNQRLVRVSHSLGARSGWPHKVEDVFMVFQVSELIRILYCMASVYSYFTHRQRLRKLSVNLGPWKDSTLGQSTWNALTEGWLSLLPWGRKMAWFSSQATPPFQMNYYTRIKYSFSCKNRLLLLEPPATFFFLFRGWLIVMGWR